MQAQEWLLAIETIHHIISNILSHPKDPKYYSIKVSNPSFNKK
jgi:hypothetical protein